MSLVCCFPYQPTLPPYREMKRGCCFLIAVIACSLSLCGQLRVGGVYFSGLERTQSAYLKQFVDIIPGQLFDSAQLETNRQRLSNVTTIGQVATHLLDSAGFVLITFECEEMVNLLPVFGLGQTPTNLWFRLGIEDLNLRGKGDELFVYYQYYDRHSAVVKYRVNRIRSSPWSLLASFTKWSTLEPLVLNERRRYFDYDNYTGGLSVIRHISVRSSVEAGVSLLQETFEDDAPSNTDDYFFERSGTLTKFIWLNNFLNYDQFHIQGIRNKLQVETIYSWDASEPFHVVFNDLEVFLRPYSSGNIAFRLRVGLSSNVSKPFAPFVLDSFINIRGVGNRVDRGTGVAVSNLEYRQTVTDHRRLATQVVGFVDAGVWRQAGGPLSDFARAENAKLFSGIGLRAIYKKGFDTLLRIDYGYNYRTGGELVAGIGQYF